MIQNDIGLHLENFRYLVDTYKYYFEDSLNIFKVEEIVIINENEYQFYLDMFKLENEIKLLYKGKYSVKINNKFLIIFDSFKFNIKDICKGLIIIIRNSIKFIFNLPRENYKNILNQKDFENLLSLLNLSNFVLIFCPEFYTLYNIKKEIIIIIEFMINEKILNNHHFEFEDILISEFLFINFINNQNRKCSISWNYRLFLIEKLEFYKFFKLSDFNTDKSEYLVNNLKSLINIFDININEVSLILKIDLAMILLINEKEKRNYHLWKYIVLIFDKSNKEYKDKIFIFIFCFNLLINDDLDYSAYSNSINFYNRLKNEIEKEVKLKLAEYIENIIKIKSDKKYIEDFIKIIY